jgi:ribonuclease HI
VYREQNKVADQLANEAMDQRRSWITTDADVVQSATLGVVRVVF